MKTTLVPKPLKVNNNSKNKKQKALHNYSLDGGELLIQISANQNFLLK